MSTGPMSASFSSVRRWPISPRWIVCIPSSSTTNATCLPRSAPFASSRYVRTPVRSTSGPRTRRARRGRTPSSSERRQEGRAVARALALGLRQRPIVGVGVGDDLAGDARARSARRPTDRDRPRRRRPCREDGCTSARTRSVPCRRFLHTPLHRGSPAGATPAAMTGCCDSSSCVRRAWGDSARRRASTAASGPQTAVSEDRRRQRRDASFQRDSRGPRQRMSGGACPIGAPARREGGWNPGGSVRMRTLDAPAFNDNRESH